MVWVRSEYAGELSVLMTWLSVFLPWNVTYSSGIAGGSLLFVRFPLFEVRYTFGLRPLQAVAVSDVLSAMALQRGTTIHLAYLVWTVGAALLAVAVVFSLWYYLYEERAENGRFDPVRVLGTLLLSTGLVLAVTTYLLVTRGFPGVPLPLGVVLVSGFGGLLLTVDRT